MRKAISQFKILSIVVIAEKEKEMSNGLGGLSKLMILLGKWVKKNHTIAEIALPVTIQCLMPKSDFP